MSIKALKLIVLIVFAALTFAAIRVLHLEGHLDSGALRGWLSGFGVWAPVVYILIYAIAPVFLLPAVPITVAGGVLFGPFFGVIYVWIGATLGAAAAFFFARYMGRAWVQGRVRGGALEGFDKIVEEKGWKIVAITRLIPVFPYNLLNYAFGLTGIRFSRYIIATFVFMLPGVVAYVVFSSSILPLMRGRITREFLIGAGLFAVISAGAFLYKRVKGGLLKRQ